MNYQHIGSEVFKAEAEAIANLGAQLDERFNQACQVLLACTGRVVVTGMGKSGHIARKIASTLASLGTPAFYMHPAEASHGDLGMITAEDTLLILSYSGNTPEIITLMPPLKRLKLPIVALTGDPNSLIARAATVHLSIDIKQEACPLGLAPTTSTTASLVMGDALAIALLQAKKFTATDFARAHPGGQLGKKLLHVHELWHTHAALPIVSEHLYISEALLEVTAKKLGFTCVVNAEGHLVGVYTDGDVRRTLSQQLDIHRTPISQVMTKQYKTIAPHALAVDALNVMQHHKITSLVGIDDTQKPIGIIHLHDLLKAGVV